MGLATSPTPYGSWQKYAGNPVLNTGPSGSWDGGQISEAAVIYYNGLFHAWYPEKDILRADIGYAFSEDGIHWVKRSDNPVTTRSCIPSAWDEHRISEPNVFIQGDTVYLFHTGARYKVSSMYESVGLSIDSTEHMERRD